MMNESDTTQFRRGIPLVGGEAAKKVGDAVFQKTQDRIGEYRLRALDNPAPMQAMLEVVGADLLVSEAVTAKIVREALAAGDVGQDDLEGLKPAMDLQIRLAKQFAQFLQLSRQIARDEVANAEAASRSTTRQRSSPQGR